MPHCTVCEKCENTAHDFFCGHCGEWTQEFWDMQCDEDEWEDEDESD